MDLLVKIGTSIARYRVRRKKPPEAETRNPIKERRYENETA